MSHLRRILCLLLVVAAMPSWAGEWLPQKPQTLVSDYSGILSAEQVNALEQRLVAFNDSTSNVICVVTVNDLGDYTAEEFATGIGNNWGVKSKDYDYDNGVVILIKPRNETDGEVFIAVGYDLEGAIPDIAVWHIIDQNMMPALREGDYNAAIDSALAYILPLAAGEISVERLYDDSGSVAEVLLGLFFINLRRLPRQGRRPRRGDARLLPELDRMGPRARHQARLQQHLLLAPQERQPQPRQPRQGHPRLLD